MSARMGWGYGFFGEAIHLSFNHSIIFAFRIFQIAEVAHSG
jgi:hypothetical protein